jgi:hypothetical protein
MLLFYTTRENIATNTEKIMLQGRKKAFLSLAPLDIPIFL